MAAKFVNIDRNTRMLFPEDMRDCQAFEKLFVQVLEVAVASKVMRRVGTVSIDGTKIHANEWNLVCSAYNMKRMFSLISNQQAVAISEAVGRA